MIGKGIRASGEQCRWVVDYQFWTEFTESVPGAEEKLTAVGLQCGPATGRRTDSSLSLGAAHQSSGGSSSTRLNPRPRTNRQRSGGQSR
jgi:hypothetical protein